MPILIPLAALQKQSLEEYLLNDWLEKAESIRLYAAESLKQILTKSEMAKVITNLKNKP